MRPVYVNTTPGTAPTMTSAGTAPTMSAWVPTSAGTSSTTPTTMSVWAPSSTGRLVDKVPCVLEFPDGTVIDVAPDGSFTINDKDAKVIYRANRVREFNPFLNASDKLEAFIKFCGSVGVRQSEMLEIPVKYFIAWLIVEAARADGEQPDDTMLEGVKDYAKATANDTKANDTKANDTKAHCINCGRFVARKLAALKVPVCGSACLQQVAAS